MAKGSSARMAFLTGPGGDGRKGLTSVTSSTTKTTSSRRGDAAEADAERKTKKTPILPRLTPKEAVKVLIWFIVYDVCPRSLGAILCFGFRFFFFVRHLCRSATAMNGKVEVNPRKRS